MGKIVQLTPEAEPAYFDPADNLAMSMLSKYFEGGKYLKRSQDGAFWEFKSTHWVNIDKSKLENFLQTEARKVIHLCDGMKLSPLVKQAMACLGTHLSGDEHALNISEDAPPVINVENGEQSRSKNLEKIWDLLYDKPAYIDYVRENIQEFMQAPS